MIPLILIEIISFFLRLVSLPVRLFANIMSGHMLIKILSQFSCILFYSSYFYFPLIFLFFSCFTTIVLLFFLELAIAVIQSYIFIILKIIYLGENK